MLTPESALDATPYVLAEGAKSVEEFHRISQRTAEIASRAARVRLDIAQDADDLLQPFLRAQRSELVAESNQIEGYDVSRTQVLEAVATHRELIDGDVHNLLQAMRADPKIITALGLYKAQDLADDWAHQGERLKTYEMRQLHQLLLGESMHGGRYRLHDVLIQGTDFRPPPHYDVPHDMEEFSDWWKGGSGDPVLDATIAHAWLTHIHPYADGNGRLARILANFALAQSHYPPLIVRAEQDRGEYYSALSLSDEGNILPLYQLFASIIRRTVKLMSQPNYTYDFLADRLLSTVEDQRSAWLALVKPFEAKLAEALSRSQWSLEHQGLPDRSSFRLLQERNKDGNGWFTIVHNDRGERRYLLWFGYTSMTMRDLLSDATVGYPSVYISERDHHPNAVHPFIQIEAPSLPHEIALKPLELHSVTFRSDTETKTWSVNAGAERFGDLLVARG